MDVTKIVVRSFDSSVKEGKLCYPKVSDFDGIRSEESIQMAQDLHKFFKDKVKPLGKSSEDYKTHVKIIQFCLDCLLSKCRSSYGKTYLLFRLDTKH